MRFNVWNHITPDYLAGVVAGMGLMVFLLSTAHDSGLMSLASLGGPGAKFAGLALILAGAGLVWRSRRKTPPS